MIENKSGIIRSLTKLKVEIMDIQTVYQKTILYAAEKHGEQKIPGSNIPYIVHVSNVCMEIIFAAARTPGFDLELALQAALLHDVLEDTPVTEAELEAEFGARVTAGVKALSKNSTLPKSGQLDDSLQRIRQQPPEIWAVKLADRITNLQPPPTNWPPEKIKQYRLDAIRIHETLKDANGYLAERLSKEIERYAINILCLTAQK
ncbi:MAG: HD domain-containing protein [Tannerella sp.]|nr:HD domain-containing protein [Tannerella sp.]